MIYASAPGKIVLCGEYVVLDGTTAIGVALDRRARVTLREIDGRQNRVTSPGYANGNFSFALSASNEFEWHEEVLPDFSLLERIWRSSGLSTPPFFDVSLDTSLLCGDRQKKFGLGSSAALTVALSAALAETQDLPIDLGTLIRQHRDYQGGRGSGIDIAVALHGGIVAYRAGEVADVDRLEWRDGLQYSILWSGSPTSTAQKLDLYDSSAADRLHDSQLSAASEAIVSSWHTPNLSDLVNRFADYTLALAEFDQDHGLGIFGAGHGDMVDLAGEHGVVYKPCGAGGGDVGIALSADGQRLDSFVAAAIDRGFVQINARIDPVGLSISKHR